MICPYCGKKAEWVENKEIYGKNYGKSYMCYLCKPCNAYVGCHNNTRKALGIMANAELRKLRIQAHTLFDPLWKSKKMSRKRAYKLIGNKHIGGMNEEECKELIATLRKGVRR